MFWLLFIGISLLSWIVQHRLTSKFKKYSEVTLDFPLTGREVAERMLQQNGIFDVKVISSSGMLTDHYNPQTKTVNLSEGVFDSRSIVAAAVAAHECGHAVQHATAYSFLKMRSLLVPIISFSSTWMSWVLLAGIFLVNVFPALLAIGILMFATTTLFSFITLPVEIDASRRALAWLEHAGIAYGEKYEMAKDTLKSAAYTYVVAALGSLATLCYYVYIFLSRRD